MSWGGHLICGVTLQPITLSSSQTLPASRIFWLTKLIFFSSLPHFPPAFLFPLTESEIRFVSERRTSDCSWKVEFRFWLALATVFLGISRRLNSPAPLRILISLFNCSFFYYLKERWCDSGRRACTEKFQAMALREFPNQTRLWKVKKRKFGPLLHLHFLSRCFTHWQKFEKLGFRNYLKKYF